MAWIAIALYLLAASPALPPESSRMDEILGAVRNRMDFQNDKWFRIGDMPRSLQTLKMRFGMDPDDFDIATNLGWMHFNLGEISQELAVYQQFKTLNPKDPNGPFPEAQFYFRLKQYDKIPALLEPTIKMTPPPHGNNFRTLAHSYERLGKLQDSKRVWMVWIKIDPKDAAAKQNLARVEKKISDGV